MGRFLGSPRTVHAVDDVVLELNENDGGSSESDSGESTFGKSMAGIQEPADGHVEYHGKEI